MRPDGVGHHLQGDLTLDGCPVSADNQWLHARHHLLVSNYAPSGESGPLLLIIVGPPAVGKMTVAHEVSLRTGLRVFHNHHTIDLVTPFFAFGTPPFDRLVNSFRQQLLTEVANSDLPGVVFTYVWAFNEGAEDEAVAAYTAPFRDLGRRVLFVELEASQEERLRRNRSPFRLEQKPVMRDLEWSEANLLQLDRHYELSSGGRFDDRTDWLRLDNTRVPAPDAAELIIEHFGLSKTN